MNWKSLRRFLPAFLIFGGLGGCGVLIISPAIISGRESALRSTCQMRLKAIAMACEMYVVDNDGLFPPISSKGKGWAELISQNSAEVLSFSCPSVGNSNTFANDYFFNARLASFEGASVKSPMATVSLGDGIENGATNSHLSELPTNISAELSGIFDSSVPFSKRHKEGANYAFVDGHVKWQRSKGISEKYSFDPSKKVDSS